MGIEGPVVFNRSNPTGFLSTDFSKVPVVERPHLPAPPYTLENGYGGGVCGGGGCLPWVLKARSTLHGLSFDGLSVPVVEAPYPPLPLPFLRTGEGS